MRDDQMIMPCSDEGAELDEEHLELLRVLLASGYAVLLTPIAGMVIIARVDVHKLARIAKGRE